VTIEAETPQADAPLIGTGHEGTLNEQFVAYVQRVRGGDMGMLPALAGQFVLTILFTTLSSVFFTKANIANLMTQTAALMMLSVALTFVIVIAEIDLSAGVTSGLGRAVWVLLVNSNHWNWVLALIVALLCGAAIGLFIGVFVAKVGIPSFVITLGLFLGLQGLMLVLLGKGGSYRVETPAVVAIMNKPMAVWLGWALLAVIVAISLGTGLYDRRRRAAAGVAVRPIALLWIRVGLWIVLGGLAVGFLSQNRSSGIFPIRGVPIVVPFALGIVWIGQSVLDRTSFGMHVFAVGGNPEAARRAGINVTAVRVMAFVAASSLAAAGGILAASRLVAVNQSSGGSDILLNAIAAAVIGGTSLFGGRGRTYAALLGILVIQSITNGMLLLNVDSSVRFMVTASVLALAVAIDSLARKGRPGAAR
jgi:D-xylose transport system permease protein